MNTVRQKEMSSLIINDIVEELTDSFTKLSLNSIPFASFPSVMLWGQPGVGKSQAIKQIANNLHRNTEKEVVVTDVRLLLFNPIDLRGIPVANEERTLAVWLRPKIFQMNPSKDVINILFLDEISAAPQSVQAAAYQITLDRKVGEHMLPDNCIVIAAGNRVTDKSVAYQMPKALANRLLHFEVESDFDGWRKWAVSNDVNPQVVGFLSFRPDYLNTFNPSSDSLCFATPRSWEMVSNILNNINDDTSKMFNLIAGIIGIGLAGEFKTWSKVYRTLPKIEDVFDGKSPMAPTEQSALLALVSSISSTAKKYVNNMPKIKNALEYALKLPKEYQILLIQDLLNISPEFKRELMLDPDFLRYVERNSYLLNGNKGYYR